MKKGFTLIELLVVVAIIGVLASVVLASLNTARSKLRDARRKSDLRQLVVALNFYYDANGSFPVCDGLGYPTACVWSTWAGWVNMLPTQYISKIPVDPQSIDIGNCDSVANCHIYKYCSLGGGTGFVLAVNLENPSSMTNNANCSIGGPNYYWVKS